MTSHDPVPASAVCRARSDHHLPGRGGAQVLQVLKELRTTLSHRLPLRIVCWMAEARGGRIEVETPWARAARSPWCCHILTVL
jgi:hypothetical protein